MMNSDCDGIETAWMDEVARRLIAAEDSATAISRPVLPGSVPDGLRLPMAYRVQERVCEMRTAAGATYVGYKVAITTRRKLRSMGLPSPIHGRLRADGRVANGSDTRSDNLILPRVEPEIAFVLKSALRGPFCHVSDVWRATEFVSGAIEILDARYETGAFEVTSAVADNVSTARYVLGSPFEGAGRFQLSSLGCVLEIDGEIIGTGAGAQVLGDPAQSVAELANSLAVQGDFISAGAVVLTGGLVEAAAVQKNSHVLARFHGMEPVAVRFRPA